MSQKKNYHNMYNMEFCSLRLHDELNDNPDLFYRQTEYQLYTQAREAAARFVGADPENLVFVQNATTGQICLLITIHFLYLNIYCTYTLYFPVFD